MNKALTEWQEKIDASPNNSIQIDMSKEILKILQKYLMHIVVGSSSLDQTKLTILLRQGKDTNFTPYECSTLSEAIALVWPQLVGGSDQTRMINPLWHLMFKLTGKCYGFTALERATDQNCLTIRSVIREFLRKRVSSKIKSDIGSDSDVLSLMMANSDVFGEEDIVDEVLDMLVAGTQTTQYST